MEDSVDSSLLDENGSPANTTFERATLTRRSVSMNPSYRVSSERDLSWKISDVSKQGENLTFWVLVVALVLVAGGNLSLTFFAMGVLRLGTGMESIEFLPGLKTTKFFGTTDLGSIQKRDGIIYGFEDEPFSITSDNSKVSFTLRTKSSPPKIEIGPDKVDISNIKEFKVTDPVSGKKIFTTEYPNFDLPRSVRNLNVLRSQTSRIVSPTFSGFDIRSDATIRLKGNEGVSLIGKKQTWVADQDIYLKAINGSIVLSGANGIFVEVNTLPLAGPDEVKGRGQYKLCLCLPNSQLFRVPVPVDNHKRALVNQITCSSFDNPCM